jgi:undecaprenyl-diphosphatase
MWLDIIILSVVEGITEFLPVSSTGHLIITKHFLGLPDSEALDAFLIIVQAGAILAVISVFWKLFLRWVLAWMQFFKSKSESVGSGSFEIKAAEGIALRQQSLCVALSVVPFAIIGFVLKDFVKSLFSVPVVAWALIVGGVFILVAEYFMRGKQNERELSTYSIRDSVIVGLGQCLALWPGFSRAGATLVFARFSGFSREAAAEISFLVGLPTLLGTASYEALKTWRHLSNEWVVYLLVGIVIAWIVAFICVKSFVAFLRRFPLSVFAYYRIVFGTFLLLYSGNISS